ncbi:unnamed protein product [Tilletia controversa]|uniref:Uncharacterized protein n=2 Tax=Tilletia TaxID=13289 RepID=A0A8X7MXQ4_9BASI|nr:hypothetical protein CF328_g974 [Tilletia controversa]KAE8262613.1 hypothetical protein A4X03_0g2319 [Tilletia caries]KAE8253527.1 hypothetical protein A4X06_0g1388 [Tilletia controversa]CAD6911481.1 unnamed protein product [Tilletia controversa]CAD6918781.1 unnamed protein product [Tilletia controversa]
MASSEARRRSASPEPRRSRDDSERREKDRHRREGDDGEKSRRKEDDRSRKSKSSHKSHRSRRRDSSDRGSGNDDDDDDEVVGPKPPDDSVNPRIFDLGSSAIGEDDFYQKAAEFKYWLRTSRKKYLDEMSSKEARKYFEKFVRRWNSGGLEDAFYKGEVRTVGSSAAAQTRHKWGFTASKLTKEEQDMLETTRDHVDTLTNANSRGAIEAREAERRAGKGKRMTERDGEAARAGEAVDRGIGTSANATATKDSGWAARRSGPAHPSDAQFDREQVAEQERRARQGERRRENRDVREEMDELAPKATGREAYHERKREVRSAHRSFADRREGDDGFDVDDGMLMGGGTGRSGLGADDFRSAVDAERDRGSGSSSRRDRTGHQQQQQRARVERKGDTGGEPSVMKQKEADTMAMFKAMAQQRFGG